MIKNEFYISGVCFFCVFASLRSKIEVASDAEQERFDDREDAKEE